MGGVYWVLSNEHVEILYLTKNKKGFSVDDLDKYSFQKILTYRFRGKDNRIFYLNLFDSIAKKDGKRHYGVRFQELQKSNIAHTLWGFVSPTITKARENIKEFMKEQGFREEALEVISEIKINSYSQKVKTEKELVTLLLEQKEKDLPINSEEKQVFLEETGLNLFLKIGEDSYIPTNRLQKIIGKKKIKIECAWDLLSLTFPIVKEMQVTPNLELEKEIVLIYKKVLKSRMYHYRKKEYEFRGGIFSYQKERFWDWDKNNVYLTLRAREGVETRAFQSFKSLVNYLKNTSFSQFIGEFLSNNIEGVTFKKEYIERSGLESYILDKVSQETIEKGYDIIED